MEQFFIDYQNLMQELHKGFIATFDDLPAEALDWIPGEDMNSLCILVVHTTGSARFWIGDVALSDSSNRNREAEFQAQGLTHAALRDHFVILEDYIAGALAQLTLADLSVVHTVSRQTGGTWDLTGGWALQHALEHTSQHLGHAQITRQLWQQR